MKYIKSILFFTFVISFLHFAVIGVSASDGVGYEDIKNEYEQMLDGIPDDIAEILPDGLFSEDISDIYAAAGEMSSFSYFVRNLLRFIGIDLGGTVRLFVCLLGILLLSALLRNLRGTVGTPALDGAVSFCTTAALLSAILAVQYDGMRSVVDFLGRLDILATSSLPLMGALYAMGGNVAAAAANNSAMVLFLTVCETLCSHSVVPVTVLCLAFALAAALSPGVDMKGISSFIKKAFTFIISFVMTLLLTVLAAQSTLAAAGDGIAAKSAKFIAGNFIPVVGGAVGESLKTVAGSIRYIRTSVGVSGIVIILLLLLPTLIRVLLTRIAFMTAGTAAKMLGCGEEASLLGELTNIYGYFLAVICSASVMFIFALTILARTSAAYAG